MFACGFYVCIPLPSDCLSVYYDFLGLANTEHFKSKVKVPLLCPG